MTGSPLASTFSTARSLSGIRAHQPRVELSAIGERDRDLVGCLNDVVVGQDVAIRGGDHPRAEARDAFRPAAGVAEEIAVERIGRHAAALHFARGVDVDDRRCGDGDRVGVTAWRGSARLRRGWSARLA